LQDARPAREVTLPRELVCGGRSEAVRLAGRVGVSAQVGESTFSQRKVNEIEAVPGHPLGPMQSTLFALP